MDESYSVDTLGNPRTQYRYATAGQCTHTVQYVYVFRDKLSSFHLLSVNYSVVMSSMFLVNSSDQK